MCCPPAPPLTRPVSWGWGSKSNAPRDIARKAYRSCKEDQLGLWVPQVHRRPLGGRCRRDGPEQRQDVHRAQLHLCRQRGTVRLRGSFGAERHRQHARAGLHLQPQQRRAPCYGAVWLLRMLLLQCSCRICWEAGLPDPCNLATTAFRVSNKGDAGGDDSGLDSFGDVLQGRTMARWCTRAATRCSSRTPLSCPTQVLPTLPH